MSTLREQMLADLQLKGLTPKTQKIYLREVSNYAKYFGKSPEQLGEKELREYLLYLLNERKLSKGTYRFYYQGLKFLYKHTLKREEVVEKYIVQEGKRSFRWFWILLKSRLCFPSWRISSTGRSLLSPILQVSE
jgi:integrase